MRRMRLLWLVIRRSGAWKALAAFLVLFFVCAILVLVAEPGVDNFFDALWFLWAVSTTVGLGDLTAVTIVGRIASMVCSVFAIVTTAALTGVIVDFFSEAREQDLQGSISEFLDKLERLPELDREELEDISKRVKKLRQ